jgi:hypothetical protein
VCVGVNVGRVVVGGAGRRGGVSSLLLASIAPNEDNQEVLCCVWCVYVCVK